MTGPPGRDASAAVAAAAARVVERTVELSLIPAPPLDEADRADRVRRWWRADGLRAVAVDPAGNVWAMVRAGHGPALLVAAHLDTVFGRDVRHGLSRTGGRLVGPGCGDDTVAVAALSSLDRLLPAHTGRPVWVVATIGEEGLGNLRGVTAALDRPPVEVGALIALEGNYLGRVNTVGVGSARRRVTIAGPGGHAWEDPDVPGAIDVAAEMIGALRRLRPERAVKATVNVGTVRGGESINARARRCVFELDLRSESEPALRQLAERAAAILGKVPPGVTVEIEEIGDRPAGRIDPGHPLVEAAAAALRAVDVEPRFTAASTDANAAYRLGLPAVTLGITYGDGTHTEDEWIEIEPIALGLRALVTTIRTYLSTGG